MLHFFVQFIVQSLDSGSHMFKINLYLHLNYVPDSFFLCKVRDKIKSLFGTNKKKIISDLYYL